MEKTEHMGYEIRFDEKTEDWYFMHDNHRVEKKSLKELKAGIDKMKKKAFERFTILVRAGWGARERNGIVPATVTSLTPDGRVWISYQDGGRERLSGGEYIYEDSPENRAKIAEMKAMEKEVEKLEAKKEKVEKSLKKIDRKLVTL
jgi:hypothetical protein